MEQMRRLDESLSSLLETHIQSDILKRVFENDCHLAMIKFFRFIREKRQITYTETTNQAVYNTFHKQGRWTWRVEDPTKEITAFIKLNRTRDTLYMGAQMKNVECYISNCEDFPEGSTQQMKNCETVIELFAHSTSIIPIGFENAARDEFNRQLDAIAS